jgi:quercetin dioxygenase-like cupin family protein
MTGEQGDAPREWEKESILLEVGESIVAPAGATSRIVSEGSASAVLLSFAVVEGPLGSVWGSATVVRSENVSRSVVLGDVLPFPSSEGHLFAVYVGRVDLPPGTILSRRLVEATEILLVTQGVVDVRVDANRAVLRQRDGVFASITDQQVIDRGAGLQVRAGTIVEYQVAGDDPVTLWRLAIEPIGSA